MPATKNLAQLADQKVAATAQMLPAQPYHLAYSCDLSHSGDGATG